MNSSKILSLTKIYDTRVKDMSKYLLTPTSIYEIDLPKTGIFTALRAKEGEEY